MWDYIITFIVIVLIAMIIAIIVMLCLKNITVYPEIKKKNKYLYTTIIKKEKNKNGNINNNDGNNVNTKNINISNNNENNTNIKNNDGNTKNNDVNNNDHNANEKNENNNENNGINNVNENDVNTKEENNVDVSNIYSLWKYYELNHDLKDVNVIDKVTIIRDPRYVDSSVFYELLNTKNYDLVEPYYLPIYSEIYILYFSTGWYSRSNQPIIRMGDNIKITNFKYRIDNNIQINKNIRLKTYLIHDILLLLNQEKLNIYFPSSYKQNNDKVEIGGIFISYNQDTVRSFENKLINNEYQIITTNNISKITDPNVSPGRNCIDVVFTWDKIDSDDVDNIITSFTEIPHYPIFISVVENNNELYVTITIMTENIKNLDLNNKNITEINKIK